MQYLHVEFPADVLNETASQAMHFEMVEFVMYVPAPQVIQNDIPFKTPNLPNSQLLHLVDAVLLL